MKWFRKLVHGAGMCLVTVGLWLVWLVGHLVLLPFGRARIRWRRSLFTLWGRWALRALSVELTVVGSPPAEPGLLVSNHLSYLDIPVLASCSPTVFVSKSEVRHWPVLGPMAATMGTVFVKRERKRELPGVNRDIARALEGGDSIVLFAEGTSTNGSSVLPFRTSLLAPAVAGDGLAVSYACLHYETDPDEPPASTTVCWWGDMAFAPHVMVLLGLRRIRARVTFGSDPILEADRKLLAEKLWQAVDQVFIPIA